MINRGSYISDHVLLYSLDEFRKAALAIRRVFSLVGHDNKHKRFNFPKILIKSNDYGSKIYSLNIKIRFRAFYISKVAKTFNFRRHPSF